MRINESDEVNVRKYSSVNHKLVAWEVRVKYQTYYFTNEGVGPCGVGVLGMGSMALGHPCVHMSKEEKLNK
jgi:hypothetical protein